MPLMLDVLIIGAGPIGMACGIEAQKKGLNYLIIEKGVLTNSLYKYPKNMTFFSTSDKLEIGDIPFVSNNEKPTRLEALEYYRRVALNFKLKIKLYEAVKSITKSKGIYNTISSKNSYQSKNVVMATGFYDAPNKLNIPGEDLDKVLHYYDEPHPYFKQKVCIVGARNSAVDAALETWRKGAEEVTMIIRENEISDRVKYWVRPDIVNRIKEGSIKAYFNARLVEITPTHIIFKQEGKTQKLENDFVLAMTGYRPDFKFLQDIGVEINNNPSKTPVYNTDTMESNIKGFYLAGVVCGGLETNKWFIENSRVHAPKIINAIAKAT